MELDEAKVILEENGYLVEKEEGNFYSVRICYTDSKGEIASTTIIEFTANNKLAEEKALNKFKKKFEYETIRWIDSEELKLKEAKQILKNNGFLVEATNKTEIDCSNWHWVKSMSSYNNNYYYDTLSDVEFYLEECDEDYGDYLYYACDKSGKKLKYLGYTNSEGSVENCNGKLVLNPSMPT